MRKPAHSPIPPLTRLKRPHTHWQVSCLKLLFIVSLVVPNTFFSAERSVRKSHAWACLYPLLLVWLVPGLLHRFLASLPDPLIPFESTEAFVACSSLPDSEAEADSAETAAGVSAASGDCADADAEHAVSALTPAQKLAQSPRHRNYRLLFEELPAAHRLASGSCMHCLCSRESFLRCVQSFAALLIAVVFIGIYLFSHHAGLRWRRYCRFWRTCAAFVRRQI